MNETSIRKTATDLAGRALSGLLSAMGAKQSWHISWIAKIPGKETSFGDGTYTFRPRLTAAMINDLRAILAEEDRTMSVNGIKCRVKDVEAVLASLMPVED